MLKPQVITQDVSDDQSELPPPPATVGRRVAGGNVIRQIIKA